MHFSDGTTMFLQATYTYRNNKVKALIIKLYTKFQVNSLNTAVMDEVRNIVNEVESNPAIEAVVLISGKPGVFIAGADIGMIESCKTKEEVVTLSKSGKYLYI